MEGVSSNLLSNREDGPPAVSPFRFRQNCEFPTGAAFLKHTVGNDVFCTLRSRSVRRQTEIRVVPRNRSFVPFGDETFFMLYSRAMKFAAYPARESGFMAGFGDHESV